MTNFNAQEFSKAATIAARAELSGDNKVSALVAMLQTIATPDEYKAARASYMSARLAVFEGVAIGKLYDSKGSAGFPDGSRDQRVQRAACAWQYVTARAKLAGWDIPIAPGAVQTGRKPKAAPQKSAAIAPALAELPEPMAIALAFLVQHDEMHPEFMKWVQPFMHPVAAKPKKATTPKKSRAMAAVEDMETTD